MRRDFMKKGALTVGAVALGLSAAGTSTAQSRENVLVYADDFRPGETFRVIDQLPASTTVRLLTLPGGGDAVETTQLDDYIGYTVRYTSGGNVVGSTTVFTRDGLSTGVRYRFTRDASFFSPRLNLISTTVRRTDR